ncbi:50S ribosomal protein L1 [Linum perenne]
MAVTKLLFSQAHHHFPARVLSYLHSSQFVICRRWFSSDSDLNGTPTSAPNPRSQPVLVQPVSYAPMPKEPTPETDKEASSRQTNAQPSEQFLRQPRESPSSSVRPEARANWSRQDARYVKDAPSVVPVSYAPRVAPLPEDKVEAEGGGMEESAKDGEDMKTEVRRVETENRAMRRILRMEEEKEQAVVPFPRLIVPEKKKEKRPLLELMDAIRQIKGNARTTFDETIEAHARLGIDKSRSDLIVRGTLTLPHGGEKVLKVVFFAEGADAEEAKAAGADIVGGVELIEEIASTGKVDFDKCYATRQLYPRVAKIARILNRHGLMPDAKQGTVVSDVTRAVKAAKQNQIKFRMDKSSIVHVGLGKASFSEESLRENIGAFMNALLQAKPAGLKKTSKYAGYVNSFHICSTMGEGYPVSIQSLSKAVDHYHKVQLK